MTGDRLARVGRLLCLGGAALGGLGLLGWLAGLRSLITIVPGMPPMMPRTGLALVLIGVAGSLRHRERAGRARRTLSILAAVVVLTIGAGTLLQYSLDLGHSDLSAGYLGRPSPPTALALTLLAAAILLFDSRPTARARPSEWLVLSAGFIAFVAMLGQLFGAGSLYRLARAPVIGLAVPTALGLLATAVGLLLERPGAGIMRMATSPGPGGILLRRLGLAAVLASVGLGLVLSRLLLVVGVEGFPSVVAVLAAAMTAASLTLLLLTAVPLDRTHEALELGRARTRALIEQASDGIFVANLEGRYTDVNSAGCRMLGYLREELLAKTIVDLIPPEDVVRFSQVKARLLAGDTDISEWTLRRKDGTYLPVEVSSRILADGRWKAFVRDIRERKEAEDRLRLSESKSSGILSISADAIISIDEHQRITMFNEGAERIFGYAKAEVMGAPVDLLVPERFRAIHRRHVERFAASRDASRRMGGREVRALRKGGEEFPADAAISKLDVGGMRLLTIALRDITEQQRIETEQRFLADLGSVLVSSLDFEDTLSGIARLAVRDLADLCIVDVVGEEGDDRRRKVASRDPSLSWVCDVLARVPPDGGHVHRGGSAVDAERPVLLQGLSPELLALLAPDEDQLRALRVVDPRSSLAVSLGARGKLLGVIVLVSSTPSRMYGSADVRLAEQLGRRAALSIENARLYRLAQRAIQARDDVLGIVAHDLRNPLNNILMQTALLRHLRAEQDPPGRTPADVIQRAATRMNRLIQDLLDVTCIEAGRLSVERDRVPAGQVVADALDSQQPLAAAASLELRLEVARDLYEDVWADRDRLVQVFENLLGNSIKFTGPGGCIVAGAAPRDGEVLFWVTDTGAGIAAEDLPHLFDRFWQARKTGRRGAGLGLPIVKGIVVAHGGRIWVESTPGCGSTTFFTIPAAPRANGHAPMTAPVPRDA